MAGITKYYRGGNSDWDTDAAWSTETGGAADTTFATAEDDAIFDANSGNCTLDADAAALSISVPNYTGTLDADASDVAIGSGGLDCTDGEAAELVLGSGLWTCAGPLDYADIGTLTYGLTSEFIMDNDSNQNITAYYTKKFKKFTVSTGSEVTVLGGGLHVIGSDAVLKIEGTLHNGAGAHIGITAGGADLQIPLNGVLDGERGVYLYLGSQMTVMDGSFGGSKLFIYKPESSRTIVGGFWDFDDVEISDRNTTGVWEFKAPANHYKSFFRPCKEIVFS